MNADEMMVDLDDVLFSVLRALGQSRPELHISEDSSGRFCVRGYSHSVQCTGDNIRAAKLAYLRKIVGELERLRVQREREIEAAGILLRGAAAALGAVAEVLPKVERENEG